MGSQRVFTLVLYLCVYSKFSMIKSCLKGLLKASHGDSRLSSQPLEGGGQSRRHKTPPQKQTLKSLLKEDEPVAFLL